MKEVVCKHKNSVLPHGKVGQLLILLSKQMSSFLRCVTPHREKHRDFC